MSEQECIACGDGANSAEELQAIIEEKGKEDEQEETQNQTTCPECDSPRYELTEGCGKCRACGFSGCTI